MNRLTLGQVRNSTLAQRIGQCAQNLSQFAQLVNEAQEYLLSDPLMPNEGWWGGWAKMVFNVTPVGGRGGYAYITTPADVARLIEIDVCKVPVRLRNGFFEFLQFGVGLQPKDCRRSCNCPVTEGYERDNVPTLGDLLPTPQYLRFYPTSSSDVGKRITPQGKDQNGTTVTGLDTTTQKTILGELCILALPFAQSLNQWTQLTGLLKDQTLGPVQIFQVGPTTGEQVSLSEMEPQEVVASYRRYLINGLPLHCCNQPCGTVQITAQAKLDYRPAQSDSDYLIIQSLPALIEEVQARRYSSMDSPNAAALEQKHHVKAIQLLNGQLDHYEGKTQTAINVPIFGSDPLRYQPI